MYALDQTRYRPSAVLFDRDGTLIADVPTTEPDAVVPARGAREALDRLRAAGIAVGVLTQRSGGEPLDPATVDAVDTGVDEMLGPFDAWQVCRHAPDEGCDCRGPQPGLLMAAAHDLGVAPSGCAVVSDTGLDITAARLVGAEAILVPTRHTLPEVIEDAPLVAADLAEAVEFVFALPVHTADALR